MTFVHDDKQQWQFLSDICGVKKSAKISQIVNKCCKLLKQISDFICRCTVHDYSFILYCVTFSLTVISKQIQLIYDDPSKYQTKFQNIVSFNFSNFSFLPAQFAIEKGFFFLDDNLKLFHFFENATSHCFFKTLT